MNKTLRTVLVLWLVVLIVGSILLFPAREKESSAPPVELSVLRMELPMPDDHTALAGALGELPDALLTALTDAGAEVDAVNVSVGTSTEATCTALTDNGVDIAFLTAGNFVRYGDGLSAILGDGNDSQSGVQCRICASESEYGQALKDLDAPSWEDWNRAAWGTTSGLTGRSGASLWLSDNYDGNTVWDLDDVIVYDTQEELENAASSGEIDVYTAPSADKKAILGETEPLFAWVAAVSSDRTDLLESNLASALEQAIGTLLEEHPDWSTIFGADSYTPVTDSDLDANRRLSALG